MNTRVSTLLSVFCALAFVQGIVSTAEDHAPSPQFNFDKLPTDERICEWLNAASPVFKDAYDAILKRSHVRGIAFKSVPHSPTAFSEVGVFFVNGIFEIRISDQLTGSERVRTLAYEIVNAYLNEEHRQIDAGAAKRFFDAREYAIAHEIYEYEAWRMYRRCLIDVERHLGEGKLPAGLFYGQATRRVKDYKLPPLNEHLQLMESSGHMKHYLDWFHKYYPEGGLGSTKLLCKAQNDCGYECCCNEPYDASMHAESLCNGDDRTSHPSEMSGFGASHRCFVTCLEYPGG